MTQLHQIREAVAQRADATLAAHRDWPCRKGCDECCRRLAAPPRISREEWLAVRSAIDALPAEIADAVRRRIREALGAAPPVVCPLLETAAGTCLVYEARPVACRAYGFYAERDRVLGCGRIGAIAGTRPDVLWGNHAALEERLGALGEAKEIHEWLAEDAARAVPQ